MTSAVRTLFQNSVFAVAGVVPTSRPTSWIGPGLTGVLAVPCYVLVSEGAALVVDTGLAVHWGTIRDGLDAILAGIPNRALIMTRREPDAISNLPAIVERYALQTVYCGGVISPLNFFESVDSASMAQHIRCIAKSGVEWLQPSDIVGTGQLRVEVLPTTLRVLPKNHLYESRSHTLFASDTWGLLPQSQAGPLEVVRTDCSSLSLLAIAAYLRHRFEWLVGIDTGPMQEELTRLLATYRIDRICSSYGCIIEGAALVASVVQRTIDALDILAGERPISRFDLLDRARLKAAMAARRV